MSDFHEQLKVANDSLQDINKKWIERSKTNRTKPHSPGAGALTREEVDALYRHNDYAGRIVDKVPEECTRRGWDVVVSEMDDGDDINPYDEELVRLRVQQCFNRADKLARKDGGSLIYMAIDDGREQLEPVDEANIRKLKHLVVVERWGVEPIEWETSLDSPEFGNPSCYRIRPYVQGGGVVERVVHSSRLLRFDGIWLPPRMAAENQYWGDSVLQRSYWKVLNFSELERDIGHIVRSFSFIIAKIHGLAGLVSGGNKEAVLDRLMLLNESITAMRMGVCDSEKEDLAFTQRSVTGLSELYDRMAQSLASSAGMPVTLLFGQAPGGLTTDDESGRTYWYDTISDRQKNYYTPNLERLIRFVALSKEGPTPGKAPLWKIQYRALKESTESELGELRHKQAQTDQIYIQYGAVTPEEIRQSRFGRADWSSETVLLKRETLEDIPPDTDLEEGGETETGEPVEGSEV